MSSVFTACAQTLSFEILFAYNNARFGSLPNRAFAMCFLEKPVYEAAYANTVPLFLLDFQGFSACVLTVHIHMNGATPMVRRWRWRP